jgi:hypothetical protein
MLELAPRAIKRARASQPTLHGAANRRQRRSRPREVWIRTYVRKGLADSSSASSSAVGVPRRRSNCKNPYARKHIVAWW